MLHTAQQLPGALEPEGSRGWPASYLAIRFPKFLSFLHNLCNCNLFLNEIVLYNFSVSFKCNLSYELQLEKCVIVFFLSDMQHTGCQNISKVAMS